MTAKESKTDSIDFDRESVKLFIFHLYCTNIFKLKLTFLYFNHHHGISLRT